MSTKVSFYILSAESYNQSFDWICKITDQIWSKQQALTIQLESEAAANQLNEMLWTFRPTSFIPHRQKQSVIYIGRPDQHANILMNALMPANASSPTWQRILQLVPNDEALKQTARSHYRAYQNSGCTIETHKVTI